MVRFHFPADSHYGQALIALELLNRHWMGSKFLQQSLAQFCSRGTPYHSTRRNARRNFKFAIFILLHYTAQFFPLELAGDPNWSGMTDPNLIRLNEKEGQYQL